jgi:hypothetical protein
MKDQALNEILKRAAVPERGAEYWEQLPGRVMAKLERRRNRAGAVDRQGLTSSWTSPFHSLLHRPALALGIAAICLALGLVLGSWKARRSPGRDPQLAAAGKYFHELEALFPNQLQAIVFDQQGTHLLLAPEANLPASPPLYVKVSGPAGCQRFITFSGQQISLNGEVCDVLVDHQGNVMLVGRQLVWSSARANAKAGRYTIEAKPLQTTS